MEALTRLPAMMCGSNQRELRPTGSIGKPIPYDRVLNRQLSNDEVERFIRAGLARASLPIAIEERPSLSTVEIAARVRKTAQEFARKGQRLGLVIVDLLGKVRPRDPRAPLVQQLGQISNDLTALAKSENVAHAGAASAQPGVEGRDNKRPNVDLRDSGNLEQDADGVGCCTGRRTTWRVAMTGRTPEEESAESWNSKQKEHILEIDRRQEPQRRGRHRQSVLRLALQHHHRCRQEARMKADFRRRIAVRRAWLEGRAARAGVEAAPFLQGERSATGSTVRRPIPIKFAPGARFAQTATSALPAARRPASSSSTSIRATAGDVSIRALAAKGHTFPESARASVLATVAAICFTTINPASAAARTSSARHRCEIDRRLHPRCAVVDQAIGRWARRALPLGGLAVRHTCAAHADLDDGVAVSAAEADARIPPDVDRRRYRAARALRCRLRQGRAEHAPALGGLPCRRDGGSPAGFRAVGGQPPYRRCSGRWIRRRRSRAHDRQCVQEVRAAVHLLIRAGDGGEKMQPPDD